MQLKVNRGQKKGGLFGNKVIYTLDVMVEYSAEEKALINGQKLGGKIIFESMQRQDRYEEAQELLDAGNNAYLSKSIATLMLANFDLAITIASLARGHHIESNQLEDIAGTETAIVDACKGMKNMFAAADAYQGGEHVIEI